MLGSWKITRIKKWSAKKSIVKMKESDGVEVWKGIERNGAI